MHPDIKLIISTFAAEGDCTFNHFKCVWKRLDFGRIHHLVEFEGDSRGFYDTLFAESLVPLLSSEGLFEIVGSIFLAYCLQQTQHCYPRQKIRVNKIIWDRLQAVHRMLHQKAQFKDVCNIIWLLFSRQLLLKCGFMGRICYRSIAHGVRYENSNIPPQFVQPEEKQTERVQSSVKRHRRGQPHHLDSTFNPQKCKQLAESRLKDCMDQLDRAIAEYRSARGANLQLPKTSLFATELYTNVPVPDIQPSRATHPSPHSLGSLTQLLPIRPDELHPSSSSRVQAEQPQPVTHRAPARQKRRNGRVKRRKVQSAETAAIESANSSIVESEASAAEMGNANSYKSVTDATSISAQLRALERDEEALSLPSAASMVEDISDAELEALQAEVENEGREYASL